MHMDDINMHNSLVYKLRWTFLTFCLHRAMAENVGGESEDKEYSTVSSSPGPSSSTAVPADWLEMEVLGFRLWMIIGFVLVGLLAVVIVLCCVFDCRIPRTKQEIDADYEKKQAKTAAKKSRKQQQQQQQQQQHSSRNHGQRLNNGDRASTHSHSQQSLVIPNPPPMPPPIPPSHHPGGAVHRAGTAPALLRGSPVVGGTSGDFQLYEKPYGRRMLYKPGGAISIDSTGSAGSRKFHADLDSTAHALASLPRQANSRV